jgi:transposase
MTCRRPYDTDLTDPEWERLKPLVPLTKSGGRPPLHSRREILNGIFYAVGSGCAWKLLPHDLTLSMKSAAATRGSAVQPLILFTTKTKCSKFWPKNYWHFA